MVKSYQIQYLYVSIIILSSLLWRTSESYSDCIYKCGNISVPYPFGIGPSHCYFDEDFAVTCNHSSTSLHQRIPYLKKTNLEIVEVRKSDLALIIKMETVTACNGTEMHWSSPDSLFNSSSFYNYENVFVSTGCDGYALLDAQVEYPDYESYNGGCTSTCATDQHDLQSMALDMTLPCYGLNNCCQLETPVAGLLRYRISVMSSNNTVGHCRSAFYISREFLPTLGSTIQPLSSVPVMLLYRNVSLLQRIYIYIFIVPIFFSIAMACCCAGICWRWKTKNRRKEIKLRNKFFKGRLQEQRFNEEEAKKTKLFTNKELKKATDNFNENRIIGKGGQGTVYKGMLPDGKLIAVKKSLSFSESHWKEFINEVIVLSHVNHRNVVKLFGCCLETKYLLLIYEFIPNGTLHELLHSPSDEFIATWDVRLRIASEVATAIAYLHSTSSTPILHRDIKSMNILLDHKYAAKVCDFGISRASCVDQTHITTLVKGTFGYFDPQYFRSNQYTEKSDVYSYGVVLFEILTGQKPIQKTCDDDARNVVIEFASLKDESAIYDMLDPLVKEDNSKIEDIMTVVNLAKCCLRPEGTGRPTMTQVSMELARFSKKDMAKATTSSVKVSSDLSREFFSARTHLDESLSF